MRNLQKILALVLALVMSFSLVTTAGAFSDDGDISQDYSDAVEVLNALKVYQGYGDGRFDPKGSITRAEVAAIIYRIATGDVTDSQASIYSSYGQFTDVADGSWYAGYVNYCANAGYVKGKGNKTFDPQGKVTGYEALAMILRAVGYDKNGEFTGSLWQVNTASIAQERGITKNVTTALLGEPASREMVAEILFRSILVSKVNFNANTLSYTEANSSIGYESFKLEEVTGVVTANEFADLYDTDVLAEGKTSLEVAPGDVRTLNYSTDLTDIGEKQNAYITDTQVLAMAKHDDVKVFESNAKLDVSTDKKFEDETGFKKTSGTEFYVNFGRDGKYDSDYRIEFNITFEKGNKGDTPADVMKWFEKEYLDGTTIDKIMTLDKSHSDSTKQVYTKILRAETEITQDDLDVIKGIFSAADDEKDNGSKNDYDGISGDVYVGTKSNPDRTDRDDDISNEISYKQFFKEYINSETWDKNWEKSNNGEWVKVIDNNNDGKAEYALKTEYWLDQAVHSRTKDGETEMEYKFLDSDDYDFRYLDGYEPEVDDVVLYTLIDGQALIQEVEPVKATVSKIDFKNETITTTGGDEYGQSGIYNRTGMDDVITVMDEKVEYNLYMDKYGYVRAYELTEGIKYGLLTELYYGYYQNGRFVTSKDLTVELRAGSEKINEFMVSNERNNDFVAGLNWFDMKAPYSEAYQNGHNGTAEELAKKNFLKPAIAHLGLTKNEGTNQPDYFFDGALTNVAKYVKDGDDGVKITSAAEYAYNKDNGGRLYYHKDANGRYIKITENDSRFDKNVDYNQPVYAVDYIKLETSDIAEDQRTFKIDITAANDTKGVFDNNVFDEGILNTYVNAVHDTEFYIVGKDVHGDGRVAYFTDYKNLDKITNKDDGINAVYAVARNTESDSASQDYWVADVIVIEVDSWTEDYDNIALAYFTNNYNGGTVRSLDTLMNKSKNVEQTVVPNPNDYTWNFRDWRDDEDCGFYKLYDTETDGSRTIADSLVKIGKNEFNKYDIYAGEITRIQVIDSVKRDNYIMVNDNKSSDQYVDVDDALFYSIDREGNQVNYRTEANELHLCVAEHSDIKEGDRIIWVGKDNAVFIVDIDYDKNTTPDWLFDLYETIWNEEGAGSVVTPATKWEITLSADPANSVTLKPMGQVTDGETATATLNVANGYTLAKEDVSVADKNGAAVTEGVTVTVNDDNTVTVEIKNVTSDLVITAKAAAVTPGQYTVTIKYVDEAGNTLAEAYTKSFDDDTTGADTVAIPEISGHKVSKAVDQNDNSVLSDDGKSVVYSVTGETTITVTYVMKEESVDATVYVNLHDLDGNLNENNPINRGTITVTGGKGTISAERLLGSTFDSSMVVIDVYGANGLKAETSEDDDTIWEISNIPAGDTVILYVVYGTQSQANNNPSYEPLVRRAAVRSVAREGEAETGTKTFITGRWFEVGVTPSATDWTAKFTSTAIQSVDLDNATRGRKNTSGDMRLWNIKVTTDSTVEDIDAFRALDLQIVPKTGDDEPTDATVTIKDSDNNDLTQKEWSKYVTIKVGNADYTDGAAVKTGDTITVSAKTVAGKAISAAINNNGFKTTNVLKVDSDKVEIIIEIKSSVNVSLKLEKGEKNAALKASSATPVAGQDGTYSFDVEVTNKNYQPRVRGLSGSAAAKYDRKNGSETEWTVTLTGVTANQELEVYTIAPPRVTLSTEQRDKLQLNSYEATAGDEPSTFTFSVTMKDSTKDVPTGPKAITSNFPAGMKVTFAKGEHENEWIGTATGVKSDITIKLESINLQMVQIIPAKPVQIPDFLTLPTRDMCVDNSAATLKYYAFAGPDGDYELKGVKLSGAYVPSLECFKDDAGAVGQEVTPATPEVTATATPEGNGLWTISGHILDTYGDYTATTASGTTIVAKGSKPVSVKIEAVTGVTLQLIPENSSIMKLSGAEILGGDIKTLTNGGIDADRDDALATAELGLVATFQISMNEGYYPVVSGTDSSETRYTDLKAVDITSIPAKRENNKVTWTMTVMVGHGGTLLLTAQALPQAILTAPLPKGLHTEEPTLKGYVSVFREDRDGTQYSSVTDTKIGFAALYIAEFDVTVDDGYKLQDNVRTEGWSDATIANNKIGETYIGKTGDPDFVAVDETKVNTYITDPVDGKQTVTVISKDPKNSEMQVDLTCLPVSTVTLNVPDSLKQYVTVEGKGFLPFELDSETALLPTITDPDGNSVDVNIADKTGTATADAVLTFNVWVDSRWELVSGDDWDQSMNGILYKNAQFFVEEKGTDSGHKGQNLYVVTIYSIEHDRNTVITLGAEKIKSSSVTVVVDKNADNPEYINIKGDDNTAFANEYGVATFNIDVKNGYGLYIVTTEPSASGGKDPVVTMRIDESATGVTTGYTAYTVEVSRFGQDHVEITLAPKAFVTTDKSAAISNVTVTGRAGAGLANGAVFAYDMTIGGTTSTTASVSLVPEGKYQGMGMLGIYTTGTDAGGNTTYTKVATPLWVLKGYEPIPRGSNNSIMFEKAEADDYAAPTAEDVAGYEAWIVYVSVNAEDIDSTTLPGGLITINSDFSKEFAVRSAS